MKHSIKQKEIEAWLSNIQELSEFSYRFYDNLDLLYEP